MAYVSHSSAERVTIWCDMMRVGLGVGKRVKPAERVTGGWDWEEDE